MRGGPGTRMLQLMLEPTQLAKPQPTGEPRNLDKVTDARGLTFSDSVVYVWSLESLLVSSERLIGISGTA